MRKIIFSFSLAAMLLLGNKQAMAQRQTMPLGRGVVAVYNNGVVNIDWRRLAQEPEDARYNIYISPNPSKGGKTSYTKLNDEPLSLTNYQTNTSAVPSGSKICVTLVSNDGTESEMSVPFTFKKTDWPNVAFKVNFADAGSPLTSSADFGPKFAWPVDLDGDGEMEYVMNRVYGGKNDDGYDGWGDDKLGGDCLEAYTRDGKHLWTVNLGVHFFSSEGQNDGVTVGDFDGDGKGEVMVWLCEGARFWDSEKNTWGKYLYYNGVQESHTGEGTETVSSDGTDPDIDKDGITNYTWYTQGKNPQYYMVVIDGMTGAQKDVCAATLPSDVSGMTYTRTNKQDFMSSGYSLLNGAMGSAFLDGVHQSGVIQFGNRRSSDGHHYFTYGYGYEGGKFREQFRFAFFDNGTPSVFHHIRIGDINGDGKDEIMNGACAIDGNGKLVWNSDISHGDRFRVSDVDPDRPGQEIFAIQQYAPDMLGMLLYDANDGSSIKRWYMSGVGDVGRGECMDVDSTKKGYEIWSTMPNMYDCKGEKISDNAPFPYEGVWWDDDLGRECCWENGSTDHNLVIGPVSASKTGWDREFELSKASNWQAHGVTGGRPMFFGDCLGDWREEIICRTNTGDVLDGFVCYSTNYATTEDRIYCLLEDPNYFGQTTNRGYYQSPCTSFYLGYDMPRPQLPPVMKENDTTKVFGLTLGNATVHVPLSLVEGRGEVFFMPVKNQTLTVNDDMQGTKLWKGMQGTLIANGNISNAVISEGTLELNGHASGITELRARGILSGKGIVDSLVVEGALNYAEGIIRPLGTLTINSDLNVNKPLYVEIDIDGGTLLNIKGNLNITSTLTFNVDSKEYKEGTYKLVETSQAPLEGGCVASPTNIAVRGLVGHAYIIEKKDDGIYLTISGAREPLADVVWSGSKSDVWDYSAENWTIGGQPATFVAKDSVIFNDNTTHTTVNIPELMSASDVLVDASSSYTFQGDGGLTGEGGLRKEGDGTLFLNCKNSDYTGATVINGGKVVLTELSMQGQSSSIGVGSTLPASWKIGKATMVFNGANLATDRGMTLTDTATIDIPANMTTTLQGKIIGSKGILRKTGNGQLSISTSVANSWKSTILDGGTLALGTSTATLGSGKLHVTGNSTVSQFYTASSSGTTNFLNAIEVDSAKTLTFVGTGRGSFKPGSLSGKGKISLSSEYVRFDEYLGSASDFEGTISLGSGAGRIVEAINMKKGTLDVQAGVTAAGVSAGSSTEKSYVSYIGNVTGGGTLGSGTWHTGYANANATFTGNFTNPVYKEGDGIWLLNPTASSTAALYVNGGEVLTAGTVPVTSSTTIVNAGGTLSGKGVIGNVTVKKGGTIGARSYYASTLKESSTSASMSVNGNLTMNDGAILAATVFPLSSIMTSSKLKVTGNATLTSPVISIKNYYEQKQLFVGKDIKLIDCSGKLTVTGNVTITPSVPMEGYEWDISEFASKGIIRVTETTAINSVNVDEKNISSSAVYDISGKRVSDLGNGIIIYKGKKFVRKK